MVTLRFVGTRYGGSQIQKNAPTIQGEFQKALKSVLGELPDVKCCSRTDSGVHANRFCISFKTDAAIDVKKLPLALNDRLPVDIRAFSAKAVPEDFHARYSAVSKKYIYKVYNSYIMDPFLEGLALRFPAGIDEKVLDSAAQAFVGTHDFKGFCSSKTDAESTVRTVYSFSVTRSGALVTFAVSANSFLYNMVRIMVGTLLNVARGKLTRADIERILASGERENVCATAAACGLYLDEISYGED